MAITVPRYRILPLRGTYGALIAEFDEINDNEICYAIDQDQYYQREGNQLVRVGATKQQGLLAETAVQPVDLAAVAASGSYSDLSDTPNAVEVGDNISLLNNNVNYLTQLVANLLYLKYTDSISALADVDTSTTAAANGDSLVYDGSNWVPSAGVTSIIAGDNITIDPVGGTGAVTVNANWSLGTSLPVYADNAAAKTGGLIDGDIYRKSDGTLMIVFT